MSQKHGGLNDVQRRRKRWEYLDARNGSPLSERTLPMLTYDGLTVVSAVTTNLHTSCIDEYSGAKACLVTTTLCVRYQHSTTNSAMIKMFICILGYGTYVLSNICRNGCCRILIETMVLGYNFVILNLTRRWVLYKWAISIAYFWQARSGRG